MEQLRKLVMELGFATANPVSPETRLRADREFLLEMPVRDLVVSDADVDLIAGRMSDMCERVLCLALTELLALKPQVEREGALAAAFTLMMFRLQGAVAQFDAAGVDLLALRATEETVRRGMTLEEVKARGERAVESQLDKLFAALMGKSVGVPEDDGKSEDEQIRRDLGR